MSNKSEISSVVKQFNSHCKQLARDLVKKFPNDAVVGRVLKRISLADQSVPLAIIESAGETIVEFAEPIYSDDCTEWDQFFTDPEVFADQLNSSESEENKEQAAYLIPKVQELARNESIEIKKSYIDTLRNMIDLYEMYLELTGVA